MIAIHQILEEWIRQHLPHRGRQISKINFAVKTKKKEQDKLAALYKYLNVIQI